MSVSNSPQSQRWFDLSTVYQWTGGVVGIVRAELEIATNLAKLDPRLRFCAYDGESFLEFKAAELEWLTDVDDVADSYLEYRTKWLERRQIELTHYQTKLAELQPVGHNRLTRLRLGVVFIASVLPKTLARLALNLFLAVYAPLRKKPDGSGIGAAPYVPSAPPEDPAAKPVNHPFAANDVVISAGWMDTGRENPLAAIKKQVAGMRIVQVLYDTILLNEDTRRLYPPEASKRFAKYFAWVSRNADFLLCGGENTRRDVGLAQAAMQLPTTPSRAIRFGGQPAQTVNPFRLGYYPDDVTLLRLLRIATPYVLCVGTIEPRKNHQILYKAFSLLLARGVKDLPLLVFAGRPDGAVSEFMDTLNRDPILRDKFLVLSPSDYQLRVLYQHALFTLLPSLYEGWSLTVPESLAHGKFCIAADVPPLREVGGDFVEYIDPFDAYAWAERILHYARDSAALGLREARIRNDWKMITWADTAQTIHETLNEQGL